jgi:hypothetical protein
MRTLMTAFHKFFYAASHTLLPAAVPVDDDNERGLATVSFDIRTSVEASSFACSADPMLRAQAALYACRATREAVDLGVDHLYSR